MGLDTTHEERPSFKRVRPNAKCHPDKPHYAHGLCDACYMTWHRQTRVDRAEYLEGRRVYEQHNRRKRFYGLSRQDYEELLRGQGNACAICGRQPHEGYSLSVDHNHQTGEIRGLLCHDCNRGIGMFKDDPKLFENVINYLKRHGE